MSEPQAQDRGCLPLAESPKHKRWPRTQRRQQRVAAVLARRQPDLTVVIEDIHDPHNASAMLRSCDGVGVQRVHLVYDVETPPRAAFARTTSASAAKWIDIDVHDSIASCYQSLRAKGFRILATAVGPASESIYGVDLTEPVALVFGNEMRGLSESAITLADRSIVIPMMGMVQSLNVSVACAVCLYEACRQRRLAGAYDSAKLDEATLSTLQDEWLRR
jgi:tRNA (guanosine-2'-O-)-methyltransferase